MSNSIPFNTAVFVLILLACTTLGRQLCAWWRIRAESFVQHTTFALLLGFGMLSIIMFFVSAIGALYTPVILILLILPMGVFWREFARGFGAFRAFARHCLRLPKWVLILLVIAALPNCLNLYEAFLPPRTDDGLSAYLMIPKQYMEAHRMVPRYDNWPSFSPFLFQSLNLVSMMLGNDRFPHILNTVLTVVIGLALFDFLVRRTSPAAALIATVAILSTPVFITKAANGSQVDTLFTIYVMCAVMAVSQYLDDDDPGKLWMAFLAMGFANTTKFVGIVLYITLAGALYCIALYRTRSFVKTVLHRRTIVFAVCLLPLAMYLVRNLIVTGNPVYPLMPTVFDGKFWPVESDDYMRMSVSSTSGFMGWFRMADIVALGKLFLSKNYYDRMTPVYLFIVPFIVPYMFRHVAKWVDVFIATFLVLCCMYVFVYFHSNRYFLPGLVAMSGLLAYRFHQSRRFGILRILITIFIIASFGLAARDKFHQAKRFYPIYKHNLTPAQYLPQLRPRCYPVSAFINQHLPDDARVLFYNENRIYYCERDSVVFGAGSAGMIYEYTDPPGFYDQLKNDGITHIVFRPSAYDNARRAVYEYRMVETLDYMKRFVAVFCTPVHIVNTVVLYKLK